MFAGEDDMTLEYPSVDDLAKIVGRKGRKSRIFIRDLSKAFRQLWMEPSSIHLLGFCFENKLYFDATLSMGSRSAVYCCRRTTNAITYVYGKYGYEDVNYLDDLGAAETEEKAEAAFDCLGWIMSTIGIRELKHKAKPPSFIAVFLGILFMTLTMTLQITPERLAEIKSLLQEWMNKKSASLKELQCLLGKLNFAASTVRAGRVFVSRLINALKEYPKNGKQKITRNMKKDINWWLTFMEGFDGITILPPLNRDSPDAVSSLDACLRSCGGWSEGEAFSADFQKWLISRDDVHINELELITFVVSLKIWVERLKIEIYWHTAIMKSLCGDSKHRSGIKCFRTGLP